MRKGINILLLLGITALATSCFKHHVCATYTDAETPQEIKAEADENM